MKLTAFRGIDWTSSGYAAGIPRGGIPVGSVIPNVIYRTNNLPVFGPPQISEMSIPVEFLYSGGLSYENAWIQLLAWLQPLNGAPGELRGVLNDNTVIVTSAVVTIPQQADEEINTLSVVFVSVTPFFRASGPSTGTAVFA